MKTNIKSHAPKILQVQCEISSGSNSGSRTKVAMARVATRSENVLGALREDRDTSSPTSTFEATSQQYDHPLSTELGKRVVSQQLEDTWIPGPIPEPSRLRHPRAWMSSSPIFHLADLAYTKLVLHVLKYPRQTVNGVLLGTNPTAGGQVEIVDAVPLYHWEDVSPRTEVGLEKTTNYVRSRQLHIVGYYEAPVGISASVLGTYMDKHIMAKINEEFPNPVALMIIRNNLHDESGAALISFVPTRRNSPACRRVKDKLVFDRTIPTRTQYLIHRDNILDNFCDFDEFAYHDGVSFFTNDALKAALNSSQ
ncbi:hypothetical protein BC827DRAFT_1202535 [Russula dissimulans]|nr:hypothetical protein BC827DRAFT_1202535 [Russula dissimulans]